MSTKVAKEPIARAGTVIAREWLGVRHEVEVTHDGFMYNGRSWRSLSRDSTRDHWLPLERSQVLRAAEQRK